MAEPDPIIDARDISRDFTVSDPGAWRRGGKRRLRAVRGVSLSLAQGETLALVGESGCGKSTLARMLLGLLRPSEGSVSLCGKDVSSLGRQEIAGLVQPVFQDPFVSLNPVKTAEQIIGLPLVAKGGTSRLERHETVRRTLDMVGLPENFAGRLPRQMSGGERQRVSIARALVAGPRALICDEPTSALDVSVQAQVLNLLRDLRGRLGLSYLIITHNLAVVDYLCERTVVMYFGRIVEEGATSELLANPAHPYTAMLRRSVLEPGTHQALPEESDPGILPDPLAPPAGCPFRPRCNRASSRCAEDDPALDTYGTYPAATRKVACHHPLPAAEFGIPVSPRFVQSIQGNRL